MIKALKIRVLVEVVAAPEDRMPLPKEVVLLQPDRLRSGTYHNDTMVAFGADGTAMMHMHHPSVIAKLRS